MLNIIAISSNTFDYFITDALLKSQPDIKMKVILFRHYYIHIIAHCVPLKGVNFWFLQMKHCFIILFLKRVLSF